MAPAATVLQSRALVEIIFAYQQGIQDDMRRLLSVKSPINHLHHVVKGSHGDEVEEMFAPLHAAITAWYSEWGHGRILRLLALLPQMQLCVIAHALWSGNLSVLTLLPVELFRRVPSCVVDFAALQGDNRVLQYLHDVVGLDVSTPEAMFNAAQSGHLDVIRYLYQLNNDTNVLWAANEAARYGHLEVVEFFHGNCASCNLRDAFIRAIERMDLVVAQCILDLVGMDHLDFPCAMFYAALIGKLPSLKWLHQRGFSCSTDAMDQAANWGHLDIVQWLHANRPEGCTKAAMHCAAVRGNLNVVEWLFLNRNEGCMSNTLKETIIGGHWEVVRFLVAHAVVSDVQNALTIARMKMGAPTDIVPLLTSAAIKSSRPKQSQR